MSMEKFFTRQKSNEGIKVPLYYPGSNEASGDWLLVVGMESDSFRVAEHQAKRRTLEITRMEEPARTEAHLDAKRTLVASLIKGWSFEKELTHENVMEFLREAPQIEEAVNNIAGRRHLFFVKESSNSVSSPDSSST